jgi:uncharacterized protein (TIRG00374 family)
VRRLHNILSIIIALLALTWVGTRIDLVETWRTIRQSNFGWYLVGLAAFYTSLPLRAWRWRMLLAGLGLRVPIGALSGVIFRAWTVNCAVPGRAGDLYSSYLLRSERGLDMASTMGTILSARVLDLLTLIVLVALVFHLKFQQDLPAVFGTLVNSALGLGFVVVVGFLLLSKLGVITNKLFPRRASMAYARFAASALSSIKNIPVLLLVTLALWFLEAFRLWCVLAAVGAPRPLAQITFLALSAAVLTTLPITPGGLGTVEALYQKFLPYTGISTSAAAGAAILDRTINYWFILAAGGIYLLAARWRHRRENES